MHCRSKLLNLWIDASSMKPRPLECEALNQPSHLWGKYTTFTSVGAVLARKAGTSYSRYRATHRPVVRKLSPAAFATTSRGRLSSR